MTRARISRTRKDSLQGTVFEIIKREDGTFDLYLNRELNHGRIHEDGLEEGVCVRFGYCLDEFDAFVSELNQNGRAERSC
jgi:hypothetical protein